jgi:hypothetical protein
VWLKHDLNSRNDNKRVCLLLEHGLEAEAVYWRVIEVLADEGGALEVNMALHYSAGLGSIMPFDKFLTLIESMITLGLLHEIYDKTKRKITSLRLEKDAKNRKAKRKSAAKGGRKTQSNQKDPELASSRVLQAGCSSIKKEKEKEKKEREGELEGEKDPSTVLEKFQSKHLQKLSSKRKTEISRYPQELPENERCVFLTATEFEKLAKDFGFQAERDYWIDEFSNALTDAIKAHPKSSQQKRVCDYTDHNRTIRNWRKLRLQKGLEFFEHPTKGADYYFPSEINAVAQEIFADFTLDQPLSQMEG